MPVAVAMPMVATCIKQAAPMARSAPSQPLLDFDLDDSYQSFSSGLESTGQAPIAPPRQVEETAPSSSRLRGINFFGSRDKTQAEGATAPTHLPGWFVELESVLTTTEIDQAQQLSAIRKALEELTHLGNGISDLVSEGQQLVKKLQGARLGDAGLQRRLVRWLKRLKTRLISPLQTNPRRFWWRW
jgi:hypothetical protein